MNTNQKTAVMPDAWYMNLSLREADDVAARLGLTLVDVLRAGNDSNPGIGALQ